MNYCMYVLRGKRGQMIVCVARIKIRQRSRSSCRKSLAEEVQHMLENVI